MFWVAGVIILALSALRGGECGHGESGEITCSVLRAIANNASSQGSDCTTNGEEDCDTITCMGTFSGQPAASNVTVLSCDEPTAVRVVLKAAGQTLDQKFNQSGQASIAGGLATLHVTLDHLDNHTIGLQLIVSSVFTNNLTILEYSKIPTECEQKEKDINECAADTTLCATGGGTCQNVSDGGFYSCNCAPGYEPNGGDASAGGLDCQDIDECADDTTLCTTGGGTCTNIVGNFYSCNCAPGYEPNGGDASMGELDCQGNSSRMEGGMMLLMILLMVIIMLLI